MIYGDRSFPFDLSTKNPNKYSVHIVILCFLLLYNSHLMWETQNGASNRLNTTSKRNIASRSRSLGKSSEKRRYFEIQNGSWTKHLDSRNSECLTLDTTQVRPIASYFTIFRRHMPDYEWQFKTLCVIFRLELNTCIICTRSQEQFATT